MQYKQYHYAEIFLVKQEFKLFFEQVSLFRIIFYFFSKVLQETISNIFWENGMYLRRRCTLPPPTYKNFFYGFFFLNIAIPAICLELWEFPIRNVIFLQFSQSLFYFKRQPRRYRGNGTHKRSPHCSILSIYILIIPIST